MSMKGKYVMTPVGPILFPKSMNHSNFKKEHPISAGEFTIKDIHGELIVDAFGKSDSLNISSKNTDAQMIKSCFNSYL